MTAKEYADKNFRGFPTFQKIARDAFLAGAESAKQPNIAKLERELKETKAELKQLWDTLYNPESCAELIAGL